MADCPYIFINNLLEALRRQYFLFRILMCMLISVILH